MELTQLIRQHLSLYLFVCLLDT